MNSIIDKVTNLVVKRRGEPELVERYLLPEFRQVNDALVKVGLELDVEPLQIVGTDGLIWNDDLQFLLERFCDGVGEDVIAQWKREIDSRTWNVGDCFVYRDGDVELEVKSDATPMLDGRIDESVIVSASPLSGFIN